MEILAGHKNEHPPKFLTEQNSTTKITFLICRDFIDYFHVFKNFGGKVLIYKFSVPPAGGTENLYQALMISSSRQYSE